MRAQWKDNPITGIKSGEAFIGDYQNAGLGTQMEYRHSKKVLVRAKLATFRGTNKGTVASLVNTSIFSISAPEGTSKGTNEERTRNEQGTTTHTDTQKTLTPFALDGTSSDPPRKIAWSVESGFSGITDKDRSDWREAFPAVNIPQQLAAASVWLKENPAKRKKLLGRFLTGWFSRNQERGGSIPSNSAPPQPGTATVGGRTYTSKP